MINTGTKCNICKRPLNNPDDEFSLDCGGDCLLCMADCGDTDCKDAVAEIAIKNSNTKENDMKKPSNEPQFQISFTISSSALGPCLALLDEAGINPGVNLIKTIDAGKNVPKGTVKDAVVEIINSGRAGNKPGDASYHDLKRKLFEMGFSKATIHTSVRNLEIDKVIRRIGKEKLKVVLWAK